MIVWGTSSADLLYKVGYAMNEQVTAYIFSKLGTLQLEVASVYWIILIYHRDHKRLNSEVASWPEPEDKNSLSLLHEDNDLMSAL